MRAHRRNRTKDQSDQGEGKGYVQYSALQEATKSNGNSKLLHFCVMWISSFPVKSGISEKWSPRELVSRTKLDTKLHCRAPFGSYCEMHIDPDITNTLEPRTNWAICMGPTGNLQGSYKFLSLATGKKVTQRKFTEMPVTDAVIKQVEEMAVNDEAVKGNNF